MISHIETVTQEKIRRFVNARDRDALTEHELDAIAYDYLNKVLRGTGVISAWPRDVKLLMASMGVAQNKTTGFPELYDGCVNAWKNNYDIEADKSATLQGIIVKLLSGVKITAPEEIQYLPDEDQQSKQRG